MASSSSQSLWDQMVACCAHLFTNEFEGDNTHEPLLEHEGDTDAASKIHAYTVGHVLGAGAFSTVRLGTHRQSRRTFALKLVDKERSNMEAVFLEMVCMRRVGLHRNVVGLVDHFELERTWVLVLELVRGGEVFDRICARGAYSERDASHIMRQVADALEHIHRMGVAHRDVKPENLLLVDGSEHALVKLCDFGLSCELDEYGKQDVVRLAGTVAYMAPEYLREERHGCEVDLWALGVVLYILLSGRHPFDLTGEADDVDLAQRIKAGQWAFGDARCWRNVSKDAQDTVRALLQPAAGLRPRASTLLLLPWLQGSAPTAQLPDSDTKLRAFNQARRLIRRVRRQAVTTMALKLLLYPPPRPPEVVHRYHSPP